MIWTSTLNAPVALVASLREEIGRVANGGTVNLERAGVAGAAPAMLMQALVYVVIEELAAVRKSRRIGFRS